MTNARFRAGMVGAGNICEFHVAAVQKLAPEVELIGVTDLDAARAQANAEKWGTTAYKDLDALVAAGANVIHVLTPPASRGKVYPLGKWQDDSDVADPHGGAETEYRESLVLIEHLVMGWLKKIC